MIVCICVTKCRHTHTYTCLRIYIYIYIEIEIEIEIKGVLGRFLPHLTLAFAVNQPLVFPTAAKRLSSLLNSLGGLLSTGCPLPLSKSLCLRMVCMLW